MDHPAPIAQGATHLISIAREFEDVGEENIPLTAQKNSSGDIYAVQIYKKGISYNKYAYGIFDNQALMSIELDAGVSYKIEMTMVPNAASVIAKDDNGGYKAPFSVSNTIGDVAGEVTNEFIFSMNTSMINLHSGYAMVDQQNTDPVGYDMPPISRFYGVIDDFMPVEDMAISIDLKWVVFGLTVMPVGFSEGFIDIEMEGAPKLTVDAQNPDAITEKIFTFNHSSPQTLDWSEDGYSEDIPTTITWIKDDGTEVVLRKSSSPITMERRMNKILNINLGGNDNGAMLILKESEILVDDNEDVSLNSP